MPHAVLSGVCEHLPSTLQESLVQAIKSSQPASPQQTRQPTPGQHVPPPAQVLYVQLPLRHEPVWQGSVLVQSPSPRHCAVRTQPLVVSQANPFAHVVGSPVWVQLPDAQASFVQSTWSSQSLAEQQLPHEADVPSALGQHEAPAVDASQSGAFEH
jgi:hypothetical protein